MKQISVAKLNELLMSLKAQRADLLEDKVHMLDHYDLDDAQDALEYEDLCDEIASIELAIDNIYNIYSIIIYNMEVIKTEQVNLDRKTCSVFVVFLVYL